MNDNAVSLANSKVLYKTLLVEKDYGVSQTTVRPGGQTEWHHHTNISDRFVVVKGVLTVELKVDGLVERKKIEDYFTVAPNVMHHVKNETADDVVYINIQSGGERDIVLDRS
jgi:beta-alanine degradation protein BauB